MSEFGENWCEELFKAMEANSTMLDQWSVDVKCQKEPYNLQSESLPQQNLHDYLPTQHNANMTNVESALIPLSNNLPNTQIEENWCEEISKAFEANSTVLDRWSVDVKCQEEPYNLQSESLPQQNLLDYPPTQHNANMTNVESALIPLPNNLPNMQIGENWCEEISKAFEANSTVLDRWSVDVKCQEEPYNLQSESLPQQNLIDYPPMQHNANMTNVESTLIPLPNNPLNTQSQNGDPSMQRRQHKPRNTWTDEEHIGLQKYGMNCKRISKEIVQTKTPSQLASHAQKYFERQKMVPSKRKRKSIHDITPPLNVQVNVPLNGDITQNFSMQNISVPNNIHPLVYAPTQNFYIQNVPAANVLPPAYTLMQDISNKDIQGQQQMPPFTPPYYNSYYK